MWNSCDGAEMEEEITLERVYGLSSGDGRGLLGTVASGEVSFWAHFRLCANQSPTFGAFLPARVSCFGLILGRANMRFGPFGGRKFSIFGRLRVTNLRFGIFALNPTSLPVCRPVAPHNIRF